MFPHPQDLEEQFHVYNLYCADSAAMEEECRRKLQHLELKKLSGTWKDVSQRCVTLNASTGPTTDDEKHGKEPAAPVRRYNNVVFGRERFRNSMSHTMWRKHITDRFANDDM